MQGPVANREEAVEEFAQRKQEINKIRMEEAQEREEQRRQREGYQGAQAKGPMLSSKEEKVKYVAVEDARLALFDRSYKKQTQFFTTYSPCLAFNDILEKIDGLDGVTDVKITGQNWKV